MQEEPVVQENTTFVGMDVHKGSIFVALLRPGSQTVEEWQLENKAVAVARLAKKLKGFGDVMACYEAGACGFALMRQLESLNVPCVVIAPALIPKKPGERVKTDRRDARKLAALLRAGLLTAVHPPTPQQEAVRDLCRARDDVRDDRMRARHRLGKFLLRHGRVFDGSNWTKAHREWLQGVKCELGAEQATLDIYKHALEVVDERLKSIDAQIDAIAQTQEYRDAVGVLRCFRGIETVTAMVILTELGDITRFKNARSLMSFLGITPSEHSSGGPAGRRLGGITKTGNGYLRRLMIEAAWHYRHRAAISKKLKTRRKAQPVWALAIAERCQLRLTARHRRLIDGGKPSAKANVAVARELTGFIWAALTEARRKTAQ
jgi:transposase